MPDQTLDVRPCTRSMPLKDATIRSDGSGRIVEAYAAAFNRKAEVRDQDGHYIETFPPNSFNRTIEKNKPLNPGDPFRFGVLFNHGRTIDGTPADSLTVPLGVSREVTIDTHGVYTVSEYLEHPLADSVLEGIKKRAIRSQSFSGRFMRSVRSYPDGRSTRSLPMITRHETDMREYGPAVFAVYDDAEILGTRAVQTFVRALMATPPDERLEWLSQFGVVSTSDLQETITTSLGTPVTGLAVQSPDSPKHSGQTEAQRNRAERMARVLGTKNDAG